MLGFVRLMVSLLAQHHLQSFYNSLLILILRDFVLMVRTIMQVPSPIKLND